jgi:cytoskeleton protein RodZ
MDERPERLPLGRYLQSLRVKKGLGLDDLSHRTHISKQNLVSIEIDDFANLPAPVHVKGFLRAYAEVLGLNPDRVLQYYTEEMMTWQESGGIYGAPGRYGFWPRFIFAICLLVGVISLTLYSATFWDQDPKKQPIMMTKTAEQNAAAKEAVKVETADNGAADISGAVSSVVNQQHRLEIIAIEATQLKVIIDGQPPKTYQLKPKDRLNLEAKSFFSLLLDNAKGVELYFNSKPIILSGKPGQNVTIQLP